jgi:hypothetical protein
MVVYGCKLKADIVLYMGKCVLSGGWMLVLGDYMYLRNSLLPKHSQSENCIILAILEFCFRLIVALPFNAW